jgi:simple sugar transport system ATP-binding protein
MAEDYVLQIKGLSKAFPGVQALDHVDMSVGYGEVHCLVGENGSGKSTLIRSVSGSQDFDEGSIVLNGREYTHLTARQAMNEGVQVIYQDLSLFPQLTVAENIAFNWMVREDVRHIKPNVIAERAKAGLDQLREEMDIETQVKNLSMAQKQIVAIARALVLDAKVIFMDEPTTALTKSEIDSLFRIIDELRGKGIATVFVSHKLDEVFRVSDNITVIRDGKKIGDFATGSLDEESLAYHMTGKKILYASYEYTPPAETTAPVLEVKGLTREPQYRALDLAVHAGEVVGITGPLGAGRTEFALSLFGLNRPDGGEVLVDGKPIDIHSPEDAIQAGIALVPEDRHLQGLFQQKGIDENLVASVLKEVTPMGLIDTDAVDRVSQKWFSELSIKAPSASDAVSSLSGGNQQRVVIGKWLATQPRLLILDGPTVGIDVASKSNIHEIVHDLAKSGMAIIIISDEIPEVYKNSNRIVVMRDGAFVYESKREDIEQEELRTIVEQGVPA